jgi:hypothetical protein
VNGRRVVPTGVAVIAAPTTVGVLGRLTEPSYVVLESAGGEFHGASGEFCGAAGVAGTLGLIVVSPASFRLAALASKSVGGVEFGILEILGLNIRIHSHRFYGPDVELFPF